MDEAELNPARTIRSPAIGDAPAWLIPAAAVGLAAFLTLAFGSSLFGDGDTSWHLAAGDWILAHRAVPRADPFSFTFAGRPWAAHEWLAEAIMAAVFAAGSWNALALLFAGLVAATLLVIGQSIGQQLAPAKVLVALVLVAAAFTPTALARPHVMGWLLLAVWLDLLLRARSAGCAPPPAAALLMLVWANLHASFLFGLALAGGLALEAVVARARPAVVRGWVTFGLLALAMTVVTPHGLNGLLFPIRLSAMRTLPLIDEWRPTRFADQPAFALLIGVGLYVIVTRRVRVPLVRVLIVAATLVLALEHARHQAIFTIVATMLLAGPIGQAIAAYKPAARSAWRLPAALFACALLATIVRLALPAAEQGGANNPAATLDRLPPALLHLPVFNGYAFGGPLIRRGIAPFIDGRADMYGDAFVEEYGRIDSGDMTAFHRAVARYGIGWTILPPATRLVAALDREPGWRRLRTDRWAVVHVRVR